MKHIAVLRGIGLEQCVGWAFDRPNMVHHPQNPAYQGGLPRAKIPVQVNHGSISEALSNGVVQLSAESHGGIFIC